MPTFEYQAVDAGGVSVNGNAIGANLESVLSDLGRRGLTVERINVTKLLNDPLADVVDLPPRPPQQSSPPRAETPRSEVEVPQPPQPSGVDRSFLQTHVVGPVMLRAPLQAVGFFFRQFATMQNAGVPIVQTMDTLAGQARDARLKPMLEDLSARVKAGWSISSGLERYPETISPVMLSLIRVGEEGGFLADALTMVADYIDREIHLRNMYKRSTFYPKLVLAVSFFIIGVTNTILASVAPGSPGLSSPLSVTTWIGLAIVGAAIWLFLRVGLANPQIKQGWDNFTLRIPVLGQTLHQLAMAKFGRAFGAMFKAGVPLNRALPLAANSCGNEYLRTKMMPYLRGVETGAGIHETLARTGAFSPIVLDMIGTGEKTGNMEQMVTKVSEYYEMEAESRQTALAMVTGVVIFLLVAIYVAVMVINFYTGNIQSRIQSSGVNDESLLMPFMIHIQ